MLAELRVRDVATIADVTLPLGPGLNVLTGETGAGKSILVDLDRTDQLDDWLTGRSHPWPWGGPGAGREIGVLMLEPGQFKGAEPFTVDRMFQRL